MHQENEELADKKEVDGMAKTVLINLARALHVVVNKVNIKSNFQGFSNVQNTIYS